MTTTTEPNDNDETPSAENGAGGEEKFEDLLSNYLDSMHELEIGQLAHATVLEVKKDYVLLDIGDKAEGIVEVTEFADHKGSVSIQPGDPVDVIILSRDSDTGQVRVSYRKAKQRVEWNHLLEAFEKGHTVHGHVVRALKTGVLVDAGVPCFLPASQLDMSRAANPESFVGQDIEAYVIEVDRPRRRGVLSRRKLLTEENKKKRQELLAGMEEGTTVSGKVKNVTDFGVFVELGGIDGLVPREEVAWEKHTDLADALKPGLSYKLKIIGVDRERERITLSRRQLRPDPWLKIEEDYPKELTVKGRVTNLTNNCAYLVLDNGIEGKIHRTNLSWAPSIRKPADVLKKDDVVKAIVIGYDNEKRLLDLGLKQISADPWIEIAAKFPVKSRHTVKITDLAPFGAFVQVDEHAKGLIHISDMSHDKSLKDPKQIVKVGDEVEAVVLKLDLDARRINFGLKQLQENPFDAFLKAHKVGSTVTGKIRSVSGFGAFVELAPLVEGLLHISQWSKEKVESLENVAKVGDEVTAKIIKIERGIKKIGLSRRSLMADEERREVEKYKQQASAGATTSLGSLLKGLKIDVNQ